MLRGFFTPVPDSLWRTMAPNGCTHTWAKLWNVIWLAWFFGDLLFLRPLPAHWAVVTAAGFVALCMLLACTYVRPRREVARYGLAMVALSFAIMPVNQFGSGTCVIYACVYVALQPDVRHLLAWVAPALIAFALEALLLGWPWQPILWIALIAVCAAIGQYSMWSGLRRSAELRLSYEEVRRLAKSAERERIGRDLHDLLGHTLSLVALKSELARRLVERDPRAAGREIADVERIAREALAQVRSAVSGIRSAALASELASAHLLLEAAGVQMGYASDADNLPPDVETCLALVLREAVTNIERHAHAHAVNVTVTQAEGEVRLQIRDDGRGGVSARGNGLNGMRERVQALDGSLTIDSPRGAGTTIDVGLPLPLAAKPVARVEAARAPAPVVAALPHAGGAA